MQDVWRSRSGRPGQVKQPWLPGISQQLRLSLDPTSDSSQARDWLYNQCKQPSRAPAQDTSCLPLLNEGVGAATHSLKGEQEARARIPLASSAR